MSLDNAQTFTFSAKEKDTETGYSYFGSRHFYEEFDLGDYLTEPVGEFNRKDLKNRLSANLNTNSIATSAMFYGIRTAMSKELEKLSDSEEWKEKAHYLHSYTLNIIKKCQILPYGFIFTPKHS